MTIKRKQEEKHEFDFVVIGGGLAGLCCAIAAARSGTKTVLIQDRPVLGGNSSSEIRVIPFGSTNFNTWARETGIMEEIQLEDRAHNHVDFFEHGMINRNYDMLLLEKVRREPNLTLFLNTSVRGVDSEAADPDQPHGMRRVVAVHASQLGSEKELVFRGKQFADCTGDATVGFLAGAQVRYGREARHEFDENMAPIKADSVTMGSTITMRALDIGYPAPYEPPPWISIYRTEDAIGPKRRVAHIKRPLYGGYWWLEVSDPPYHQIDDNQAVMDELHKHVLGVWNYIKNHSPLKEHASTYVLDWIGVVPGKRESRRLVGDVTVTEHDVHTDRQWEDRVCTAGWTIDLHIKGGILNKDEPGELSYIDDNYNHYIRAVPFTLPLRAFYCKDIQNLWMAGRNISVTHVAMGATRVQQIHANQGQAVGTAAAYAIRCGLTPRQAANPEDSHIKNIQQQILREDMSVLGLVNQDPLDLARNAKVSATSDAPLDFGNPRPNSFIPLTKPLSQVFPLTDELVDSIAFYLKNQTDVAIEVEASLCELHHIWDKEVRPLVASATIHVPANSEGWYTAEFNAAVVPGKPYRVSLGMADGVSWSLAEHHPTGTTSQFYYRSTGGAETKNAHVESLQHHEINLPVFERWIQEKSISRTVRISPVPRPYGAQNVNNGVAAPYIMPNLWVSDPDEALPQSVILEFDQIQTFNTVSVAFDTNLNLSYTRFGTFWKAPTCARHWRVYAEVNGAWEMVYEETDNYFRRRVVKFDTVTSQRLRLEIVATNKDQNQLREEFILKDDIHPTEGTRISENFALKTHGDTARIYELRVYNE
jgi:hypothetical protein